MRKSFIGRNKVNQDTISNVDNNQTPLLLSDNSSVDLFTNNQLQSRVRNNTSQITHQLKKSFAKQEFESSEKDTRMDYQVPKKTPQDYGLNEDIPNNTDRSIDFQAQLDALKKRTECSMPFTLSQVEDAMFLDQFYVVTLEFHYYQNDCIYSQLRPLDEKINQDGDLVDANGHKVFNAFSIEQYQKDESKIHPMSKFDRKNIVNYATGQDLISSVRSMQNSNFMRVDPKYDVNPNSRQFDQIDPFQPQKKKSVDQFQNQQLIEGILALYKISPDGGMQRYSQIELNMGRKYQPSANGNMQLTRSKDKKVISVTNFDKSEKDGNYFKILAWTRSKTNTLKVFKTPDNFEALQQGLNKYFNGIRESFDELIEISFVNNSKSIQLIYWEAKKRSLVEQQQYELQIERMRKHKEYSKSVNRASTFDVHKTQEDNFQFRQSPRRAKKYVFFDTASGKIQFEYGGIRPQSKVQKQSGEMIDIYELGCLFKEIREEGFSPQIIFFFAGDFMEKSIKEKQIMFQYAMNYISIDMSQILELDTQEEKMNLVLDRIKQVVAQNRTDNDQFLNYFPFNHEWIQGSLFNWEQNIDIVSNRKFDLFSFLNQPSRQDDYETKSIYVHGMKFREELKMNRLKASNFMIEPPFYSKLLNDNQYRHTRNSHVKDQLFYDSIKGDEIQTICMNLDNVQAKRVNEQKIKIPKCISLNDIWLHPQTNKKNREFQKQNIFQMIHVTSGNQDGILQTQLPNSKMLSTGKNKAYIVSRKTSTFYKQVADHPCIAYNLGDNKIVLQTTFQENEVKKKYILHLKEDEKFVCFLNFNEFEDIGFYCSDIRISACSHFAYMSNGRGEGQGIITNNKINLIVMDPFYNEPQITVFSSSWFYDNDIFFKSDSIIQSVCQSTMGKKNDLSYHTYIWTQFQEEIIRSKVLTTMNQHVENDSDHECDDCPDSDLDIGCEVKAQLQPVKMILGPRDFIFYVTLLNGKCEIMEGNPRDPYIQHHESIYSLKADKCLAFCNRGTDVFFFMDQDHIVYMLTRGINNRKLNLHKELTMKEIQRLDFNPDDFDNTILTEKFAIQGSKIFYLYDMNKEPFPEGVFESEEIVEQEKSTPKFQFIQGPIRFDNSTNFFNMYQINKFKSIINIQQRPDSTAKTLVNDFLNWVDMSTFLEDGKILVKNRRRFMIFSGNGNFIDEVEFNDDILAYQQPLQDRNDRPSKTLKLFREDQKVKKSHEKVLSAAQKLYNRKIKDPILDFRGNQYDYQNSKQREQSLSHYNKMELINMSYNNKWFLFYNRMTENLYVYELVCQKSDLHMSDFQSDFQNTSKVHFQFVLRYGLDFDKTSMFQHLYSIEVDPIEYYRQNLSQVKVGDQGQINLCYVENRPFIDIRDASQSSDGHSNIDVVQCMLIGALFKPQGDQFYMQSQCFMQNFDMPRDAQKKLDLIFETKKTKLERKINNIRVKQARLPKKLFDYNQFENCIDELITLESKNSDHVFAKIFCENLVIVYCGNYVKFGYLIPNQSAKSNFHDNGLIFQTFPNNKQMETMHASFDNSVEVIKVIETVNHNWLQVVAQDHTNEIFTIVTWDFENNMEQSMMQCKLSENDVVGYHVIKGMNRKMNYFLNQHYLTDLEYNIPLKQKNVDQNLNVRKNSYDRQITMINDLFNQRKLNIINENMLGVENASVLYYPFNRLDLILWRDINLLGEKADLIKNACTLDNLNIVIDGISLFHYFSGNSEIIKEIKDKYNTEEEDGHLSQTDKTLPLQILNPDNHGNTALYLSIQSQSPQSFECMIQLLSKFPEQCISKMMLMSLKMILCHPSQSVINFFDTTIFYPPQMQIERFIPWEDEDLEEIVFPSHTSIISINLLVEKMKELGMDVEMPKPVETQKVDLDETIRSTPMASELIQKIQLKTKLRSNSLRGDFDFGAVPGQSTQNFKKVQIEALDFDWIFEGDNAQVLLSLLADEANNEVLTKKSIKIFIDLMWVHYQKAIINCIFVPYMIYLAAISLLAGKYAGELILISYDIQQLQEDIEIYNDMSLNEATSVANDTAPMVDPTEELNQTFQQKAVLQIISYALINVATCLMMFFSSCEIQQLAETGFLGYFNDYWNCIDGCSIAINFIFIFMCTFNLTFENEYWTLELVRTFGAFAGFFMWIKVFYWMRLFKALAYYVKLIQQTISDSMPFMLMVSLIIFSFATFYFVIDLNLQDSESAYRYYGQYTNHTIIDVLISIYMMGALGDFENTIYRVGYDTYFAMMMFCLATFIISVVFMNMLIAIMGETFGKVSEESEQSGLREQVVLIADHAWLIDINKLFKNQKYVMVVKPSQSQSEDEDKIVEKIKDAEVSLLKRINRHQGFVQKRIDSVDINTRFLLKYQQMAINSVSKRVKNLDKKFEESLQNEVDEDQDLNQTLQVEKKYMMKRKKEILKSLNHQTSGNSQPLSPENIQEFAMNWMELADKNGDGELDYDEFYEFFSHIETIQVHEDEIKQIFKSFDTSKNGFLSVEEFARAIYQVILADNDDYSEDQSEEQQHQLN